MNNFLILDCTLRDGGYINKWQFGQQNIVNVLSNLTKANIDIIECGFLEDVDYNPDCSLFSDVTKLKAIIPSDRRNTQYVAMTRLGYLNLENLVPYDGTSIDGIRVTFHENEVYEALEYCRQIKAKGYKVYVQPVGTTSYTDKYLLSLIEQVNELEPYAFYIVDTLGLMRQNDVQRMYYLLEKNLNDNIVIGFHSHNNLQLSFSNAQVLSTLRTHRTIIVDSSVYGMGRGAGNLNTELIAQHLNMTRDSNYDMNALLEIVDETITPLLKKYEWGYTVPYYLAAINSCHPNYASYLMNRKTLTVKAISSILTTISKDERELYNKELIERLYLEYQKHTINDMETLNKLSALLDGKEVVIVAPGASISKQEIIDSINMYIVEHDAVVITVNFNSNDIASDFCFFSNDKRFQKFISESSSNIDYSKLLLTSNIKLEALKELNADNELLVVNYGDYLNNQPLVNDNATLMVLSLLNKLKVTKVVFAGFDGFNPANANYLNQSLENNLEVEQLLELNNQIKEVISKLSSQLTIEFLTDSIYRI